MFKKTSLIWDENTDIMNFNYTTNTDVDVKQTSGCKKMYVSLRSQSDGSFCRQRANTYIRHINNTKHWRLVQANELSG